MSNRKTNPEEQELSEETGHIFIRLRDITASPHLRLIIRFWPLILLAAVNIVIVFLSEAPSIRLATVAFGTVGIALGVRVASLSSASGAPEILTDRMPSPRTIYWTVGAALHIFVLFRVLTGATDGLDVLLWAVAIVAFGAPFVSLGELGRLIDRLPIADTVIVAGLMFVCVVLHSNDLINPLYTTTGDNIAFFHAVRRILEHGIERPFSIQGVYDTQPMLNSIYQASVSWVFGGGVWGWKFASVLSVALAVPAVYGLGYLFRGRVAGLVAAAVLLSSHYVMAFSHIGYNQLDALPVIAWAVFAFIVGHKRKSAALLFAAGVIAGLGMYTILSARIALPIFAVYLLINRMERRRVLTLWPVALGFVVCVLPLLAESGLYTITVMGVDTISP